jgi:hypothetical protein
MGGSYVTEGVSWKGDMDYESLLVLSLFPEVRISSETHSCHDLYPAMGLNAVGQINMK